jgi:hypothetical protein
MSKFKVENSWKTGKTNSERKGMWQQTLKLWSEETRAIVREDESPIRDDLFEEGEGK